MTLQDLFPYLVNIEDELPADVDQILTSAILRAGGFDKPMTWANIPNHWRMIILGNLS